MRGWIRSGLEALAGLLLVGGAVAWLSGGCERRVAPGVVEGEAGAASGEVRSAPVELRVEPAFEWASGAVASARQTAVSSRVLARIEEVRVRAGQAVSQGEILIVLDARDLRARAGEAEEALRSVQAQLELSRREYQRAEKLLAEGVASQQRLDRALSERRTAQAEVDRLREALEEARAALSYAEIRAPVAGQVVDRLAEPGDTAVPGRPLLRVYDPTLLRVEVPVRESLAVRLRVGQALRVEIPALDDALEGEIDEIVPFAEPGARTLLVKVRLPRSEARVFAGLFARVAIPAGERQRLLVPAVAVERVGQLAFTTVIRADGGPEPRLVTIGPEVADAGSIEVLSGLRAGERVRLSD